MNVHHAFGAAFVLITLACVIRADEPTLPALPSLAVQDTVVQKQAKQPDKGKDKKQPEKKPPETKLPAALPPDLFAQTSMPQNESARPYYNPHMMGDFFGYFARVDILVPQTVTTQTTTIITHNNGSTGEFSRTIVGPSVTVTTPQVRSVIVPFSLGAIKIAENATPMPGDRVYLSYNYYDNLAGPGNGSNGPATSTQSSSVTSGDPVTVNKSVTTNLPAAPAVNSTLNRQIFGVEKSFFNGMASLAIRMPFSQLNNNIGVFGADMIGDLTVIGKVAAFRNPQTGNVLSGGLAVTVPTSLGVQTFDGTIRSTWFQPYAGYIVNYDRFYLQAFHSVAVPTDPRDITLMFNDVGVNYWLYRASPTRTLNYIVPALEAHLTTPLNHRGPFEPVTIPDTLVFTGGIHIGLFRSALLSFGVGTPITGPRPFSVEAVTQFTWRF